MLRDPFSAEDEASLYVPRQASEAALTDLEAAVRTGPGVAALIGPVGIGKSLLLKVLESKLSDSYCCVRVDYEGLSIEEFCQWVLRELDARETLETEKMLTHKPTLAKFREWMQRERSATNTDDPESGLVQLAIEFKGRGFPVTLLIDAADALKVDAARRLRTLVKRSGGALRLVLAITDGLPESMSLIESFGDSCVCVRYEQAMSLDETILYIKERLAKSGASEELRACLDESRIRRLFKYSQGNPRRLHGEIGLIHLELSRVRAGVGPAPAAGGYASPSPDVLGTQDRPWLRGPAPLAETPTPAEAMPPPVDPAPPPSAERPPSAPEPAAVEQPPADEDDEIEAALATVSPEAASPETATARPSPEASAAQPSPPAEPSSSQAPRSEESPSAKPDSLEHARNRRRRAKERITRLFEKAATDGQTERSPASATVTPISPQTRSSQAPHPQAETGGDRSGDQTGKRQSTQAPHVETPAPGTRDAGPVPEVKAEPTRGAPAKPAVLPTDEAVAEVVIEPSSKPTEVTDSGAKPVPDPASSAPPEATGDSGPTHDDSASTAESPSKDESPSKHESKPTAGGRPAGEAKPVSIIAADTQQDPALFAEAKRDWEALAASKTRLSEVVLDPPSEAPSPAGNHAKAVASEGSSELATSGSATLSAEADASASSKVEPAASDSPRTSTAVDTAKPAPPSATGTVAEPKIALRTSAAPSARAPAPSSQEAPRRTNRVGLIATVLGAFGLGAAYMIFSTSSTETPALPPVSMPPSPTELAQSNPQIDSIGQPEPGPQLPAPEPTAGDTEGGTGSEEVVDPSAVPEPPILTNVNAKPWATIEIDGRLVGETPLGELPLAPGPHEFRATMPGGRVIERTEVISANNARIVFE